MSSGGGDFLVDSMMMLLVGGGGLLTCGSGRRLLLLLAARLLEGGGGGSGVEVVDIPYRQNRCTIFRSNLLHETAPSLHFKPGYANRRINLTFMFGNSALWGI
mmetsp:Transcript_30789/g.56005  ORF Transcript_30789/g.56005 Transcript_30789/m.56005 type:complete len:103 (+) Transcript_30789:156-464(+)